MLEDEETSDTLKSAHLSEWIHKNGGDPTRHHHHDPYHIDGEGKETLYTRPGGGYNGVGFNHAYKDDPSGGYGSSNQNYSTTEEFLNQKPKSTIYGLANGNGEASMPEKINPWWNKLEKNQFDGMHPRKEYDQVAKDIIDSNKDADIKVISNAVLRREYEF